ncbi:MAG: hypothetical protein JHC33_04495 [Ignisphaera sp.]|jgi:hypothetical protein|nr:hypothetical protein [Ignisphaera sp.]
MDMNDYVYQDLMEELRDRRTNATEMDARIRQLLGDTEQLRKDRDEARREICVLQVLYSRFYHVGEESECAKDREWDCFKETP